MAKALRTQVKYSIISINDKRQHYKDAIRRYVGFEEERIVSVDGAYLNRDGEILEHLADLGLKPPHWPMSVGEIGVWMSNFLHWEHVSRMDEPLIVFEDDAIIREGFPDAVNNLVAQLPEDWDFLVLWVPDNQRIDYRYNLSYNKDGDPEIYGMRPEGLPSYFDFYGAQDVARVYQGYGTVSMLYSPAGGKKLAELAKFHGLRGPVDCFVFQEAHKGAVNGYAPKPDKVFVDYDWPATQIHNTEIIK